VEYAEHIVDLVGNTPLVRLNTVAAGLAPLVLAKVEYLNPGGSVKTGSPLRMVEAAERSGALRPGGTIVEPTSGNTGVGLAMIAQRKGTNACSSVRTRCPRTSATCSRPRRPRRGVPDGRAAGAPRVLLQRVRPAVAEIDGAWKPDQYSNPENPASHIWAPALNCGRQTEGRITHFVAGVGPAARDGYRSLSQEVSGGRVRIIGRRPGGLRLLRRFRPAVSGGRRRRGLLADHLDRDICDEIIAVSTPNSFDMTRRLAARTRCWSAAPAAWRAAAALRLAERLAPTTWS